MSEIKNHYIEVDPKVNKDALVYCKSCGDAYIFKGLDGDEIRNRVENIQDLLPNLAPKYREMFLSGLCPKCWDDYFKYGLPST